MKQVFLSFSFRDQDKELVAAVEQLLASHEIQVVTGKVLGGGELTEEVMARIDRCDGLVALLTRRDQLADGGWTTHDWVRDELNHARNGQKRAIALIEEGVQTGGAFAEHERIDFRRAELLPAILRLSQTIGLWKREAGRLLKISILPDNLAQQAALAMGEVHCRYRFIEQGEPTPWQEARQVGEVGGTYLYIRGVQDDHLIQLQIEFGGSQWRSLATPPWVPIELQQIGGQ